MDISELIKEPSPDLHDDQVWQEIIKLTGVTNASSFQKLPDELRRSTLLDLKESRASLRQLSRLTGIGKGVIHRIWQSLFLSSLYSLSSFKQSNLYP